MAECRVHRRKSARYRETSKAIQSAFGIVPRYLAANRGSGEWRWNAGNVGGDAPPPQVPARRASDRAKRGRKTTIPTAVSYQHRDDDQALPVSQQRVLPGRGRGLQETLLVKVDVDRLRAPGGDVDGMSDVARLSRESRKWRW